MPAFHASFIMSNSSMDNFPNVEYHYRVMKRFMLKNLCQLTSDKWLN